MRQTDMMTQKDYDSTRAEISFDCFYGDDCNHIEGCYHLPGEEWQVFYFTRDYQGPAGILINAVWRSGIRGVNVKHPKSEKLNIEVVKQVLARELAVSGWTEIRGPDSLQMK